jgi:hypothetical protein
MPAAARLSATAPPMGFSAFERLRSLEPTQPRACLTRYVASSGFSRPPDAFLLQRPPRLCFTPRTLGPALRSFPLPRRDRASRPDRTHVPLARNGRTLPRPPWPDFWVLLPSEVRISIARRSQQPDRGSLGLRLSRGFLPVATVTGFPVPSSHELHRGRCETRRLLPRVSIASGPVRLRGDHHPS